MARGVDNARIMDAARVARSQSAGVRAFPGMLGICALFEIECLFKAGDLIGVDSGLLVCDLESKNLCRIDLIDIGLVGIWRETGGLGNLLR
jgi:hypothetical protein